MSSRFLFLLGLILTACTKVVAAGPAAAALKTPPGAPLCWSSGHRGNRDSARDNSIAAIVSAAAAGVPLIEIDVRMIRGGGLYLFHDKNINPKNSIGPAQLSRRPFTSLSEEDLQKFILPDVKTPVPSLREAAAAVRPYRAMLQLDVKGESAELIDRIIDNLRLEKSLDRVVIQCQTLECLKKLRREYPEVLVLARTHRHSDIPIALAEHPAFVQIDLDWANPKLVRKIHAGGSRVFVKTLGENLDVPRIWKKNFEMGIDGQLTDHPLAMQKAIQAFDVCKPHGG